MLLRATLAASFCVACAGDSGRTPASHVVPESAQHATGAALQLAHAPHVVLRYDDATGVGPLDAVGAVRLANGTTVVASAQSVRLEFYSATGALVRTVGRRGKGPGEFGAIAALWRTEADSLITFEGGLTRSFSIFDSSGHFARAWTSIGGDSSLRFVIPLDVLPDGRIAARTMNVITPLAVAQTTRPLTSFLLFAPDWNDFQRLRRMRDASRFQGPGELQSEVPFSPEPLAAFSRDALYFAESDSAVVYRQQFGDSSVSSIRWRQAPRAVAAADIERELARRIAEARLLYSNVPSLQRRFIDGAIRPLFQQMPIPPSFPRIGRLLVDSEGLLWVLSFVAPADRSTASRTARVFDASGALVGQLELRAGFEPTQVGRDFVLGIRTDGEGVTAVEGYALRRAKEGSS
ncbi:MAG: hypothetical protein U0164_01550 [Gemmatimonadaceae bacterium]